jgi:DNA-binding NarL/FixJ family response regulator
VVAARFDDRLRDLHVAQAGTPSRVVDALIGLVGRTVTPPDDASPDLDTGAWPGKEHGLFAREAEVIALITQGLTNQEIADKVYLSINSVKTYIHRLPHLAATGPAAGSPDCPRARRRSSR